MLKEISIRELEDWKRQGRSFQLIDVREPGEHQAFDIGGELMPLSSLTKHTSRLLTNQPVVVYCKRGIRSQLAIQRWQVVAPEVDFYNLKDGIGLGPK